MDANGAVVKEPTANRIIPSSTKKKTTMSKAKKEDVVTKSFPKLPFSTLLVPIPVVQTISLTPKENGTVGLKLQNMVEEHSSRVLLKGLDRAESIENLVVNTSQIVGVNHITVRNAAHAANLLHAAVKGEQEHQREKKSALLSFTNDTPAAFTKLIVVDLRLYKDWNEPPFRVVQSSTVDGSSIVSIVSVKKNEGTDSLMLVPGDILLAWNDEPCIDATAVRRSLNEGPTQENSVVHLLVLEAPKLRDMFLQRLPVLRPRFGRLQVTKPSKKDIKKIKNKSAFYAITDLHHKAAPPLQLHWDPSRLEWNIVPVPVEDKKTTAVSHKQHSPHQLQLVQAWSILWRQQVTAPLHDALDTAAWRAAVHGSTTGELEAVSEPTIKATASAISDSRSEVTEKVSNATFTPPKQKSTDTSQLKVPDMSKLHNDIPTVTTCYITKYNKAEALGLSLHSAASASNVVVTHITPTSPVRLSSLLRPGHSLLAVNQQPVSSALQAAQALAEVNENQVGLMYTEMTLPPFTKLVALPVDTEQMPSVRFVQGHCNDGSSLVCVVGVDDTTALENGDIVIAMNGFPVTSTGQAMRVLLATALERKSMAILYVLDVPSLREHVLRTVIKERFGPVISCRHAKKSKTKGMVEDLNLSKQYEIECTKPKWESLVQIEWDPSRLNWHVIPQYPDTSVMEQRLRRGSDITNTWPLAFLDAFSLAWRKTILQPLQRATDAAVWKHVATGGFSSAPEMEVSFLQPRGNLMEGEGPIDLDDGVIFTNIQQLGALSEDDDDGNDTEQEGDALDTMICTTNHKEDDEEGDGEADGEVDTKMVTMADAKARTDPDM